MTFDNGTEFAQHAKIARQLDMAVYFAKPYCSWQRGTNENTIGLVRQFIPKGEPLSLQTQGSVARIERLLNSRPRACLGFKTPAEVLLELRNQCRNSN